MTRITNVRGWGFGLALGLAAAVASTTSAQDQRLLLRPDGPSNPPRLGIQGYFRWGQGLVVERVFRHSPAERLGLEPGDVILRVNDVRVRRDGDLQRAMANCGGSVRLLVDDVRGQGPVWTRTVSLQGRGPSRPYLQRDELARFQPQTESAQF